MWACNIYVEISTKFTIEFILSSEEINFRYNCMKTFLIEEIILFGCVKEGINI